MMVRVVEATNEHVPDIVELWKQLMDFHKKLDTFFTPRETGAVNFERHIRNCIPALDSRVFVALGKNKVIGYALCTVLKHPPVFQIESYGYIHDMMVAPSYRKQGCAKKLLAAMIHWYTAQGINRVELSVSVKNTYGIAFWRHCGFQEYLFVMYKQI